MIESFSILQELHANHFLDFRNPRMYKLIESFSFTFINKNEELNIDNKLQASKIIVINKYDNLSLSYYIICFDNNLILIEESNIYKISPLFHSSSKSTIYSLSSDTKSLFFEKIQLTNQNNLIFTDQDIIFKKEIESFSSQFEIKNKEIQEIWKLIRLNLSAYLIKKAYIDSFCDRMKNYKEILYSQPKEKIIKKDEIINLRNICTGNKSNIKLIYHIPQEKLFLIKIIKKEYHYLFIREHKNYLRCNHPFLPKYFGIVEYDSENYLAIEYIQGNSLNWIHKMQFDMYEKIKIVFELLIVFQYIHYINFIYRDLNPNNLIIDSNNHLVLIDLDEMIVNSYENIGPESTHEFTDFGAPEFSSNSKDITFKVDIFSIGKIINFIFFQNEIQLEFKQEYLIIKEIYELCTNIDPEKRPNISELIDYFYDKMYLKLFEKILNNNLLYNDISVILENSYQKSLNNFGMFHLFRMQSESSNSKGIYYLKMAAKLNCAVAQYNLGFIYYEARHVQRKAIKAIKYLSLAANQNLAIAQLVLGILYYKGKYIEHDINKSVYYLNLALNNGDPDALYTIGSFYYYDEEIIHYIDKNITYTIVASGSVDLKYSMDAIYKSILYFKKAADQNHAYSQLFLGLIYYNNRLIPNDINQAIHYFTLSINLIDSQFNLGNIYYQGTGVKKDIQKTIYYLTLVSEYNLNNSQNAIELIEDKGNIIAKKAQKRDLVSDIKMKANAQYELGIIYCEGIDTEKNTKKGIYYLQLAAGNNHADAQYYLGSIYLNGIYAPKDIYKAINFFLLAANQNETKSEFALGYTYFIGIDVDQDINKAIHYLTRAASKDYYLAQYVLGNIYLSNKFSCKDTNRAVFYLTKAAEQNYSLAQNTLGDLYCNGKIIDRDIKKGIYYYKLAANQNNDEAQFHLGKIYYDGIYVCKDINLAKYYLFLSANQNNKNSQFLLGEIFYENLCNQQNLDKAIYYFTLASNQNHFNAQFMLGLIYSQDNIYKDIKKSIYYYTLAANSNVDLASHNLGMIYIEGNCVPQDKHKGIEYLTRAAKNDFQVSQVFLGFFYYNGVFVSQDIDKGIQYIIKASKGYHGQYISVVLGNIYLKGKYLPRDVDKAIYYYKDSSCFNNNYAKNNIGIVYKNGCGKPKRIADAIQYFKESIQQKNDPVSMYNLAHIYFYNENIINDSQTIIDLLVNSYYNNFTNSIFLLLMVLNKKHNQLTTQIIENEINHVRKDTKKLTNELSKLKNTCNYIKLSSFLKYIDFIYDDHFRPVTLFQFLYNKIEKVKRKNINNIFYEGFGFDV